MVCKYCENDSSRGCGYVYVGHGSGSHFICTPCFLSSTWANKCMEARDAAENLADELCEHTACRIVLPWEAEK